MTEAEENLAALQAWRRRCYTADDCLKTFLQNCVINPDGNFVEIVDPRGVQFSEPEMEYLRDLYKELNG